MEREVPPSEGFEGVLNSQIKKSFMDLSYNFYVEYVDSEQFRSDQVNMIAIEWTGLFVVGAS
jgi:hypothetical protein